MQVCTAMGCSAGFASAPVSGKQLQQVAIQGSLSLALAIGQAVQRAHTTKADPVATAATAGDGILVFTGSVFCSHASLCKHWPAALLLMGFAALRLLVHTYNLYFCQLCICIGVMMTSIEACWCRLASTVVAVRTPPPALTPYPFRLPDGFALSPYCYPASWPAPLSLLAAPAFALTLALALPLPLPWPSPALAPALAPTPTPTPTPAPYP